VGKTKVEEPTSRGSVMTPNYMNNEDFEKQFLSEDY
jgi:hypothetical protein